MEAFQLRHTPAKCYTLWNSQLNRDREGKEELAVPTESELRRELTSKTKVEYWLLLFLTAKEAEK
jgi:hypothetical protein